MEGIVILVVLLVLWLLIAPVMAMVRAGNAEREAKAARQEIRGLHERLRELERELRAGGKTPLPAPPERAVETEAPVAEMKAEPLADVDWMDQREHAEVPVSPPPLPVVPARRKPVDFGDVPPPVAAKPAEPKEPFSWEKFMGVKLFAWLGGVAMFFGVIFFVKYAFDNNLISPALRVALGFITGTGLLAGGLWVHRLPRYRVLAQAFCATGVLVLYGVSFAAHAVYHFAAFGPVSTFVLMALITLAAFLVAVRLDALVVAVLGMLGGFLTPVLLATGNDNVFGLFGYIAMLDIGLLAVSRHRKWSFLTSAAAVGTVLTQIGWFNAFFSRCGYHVGARTLIPMGVMLFFAALFLAGDWLRKRRTIEDVHSHGPALGMVAVAMGFAFVMLGYRTIADRWFLLYGYVLLVQVGSVAMALLRPRLALAQVVAALAVFAHLAVWSVDYLKPENLHGALALYLVFGALHAVVPVALFRGMPEGDVRIPFKAGPWFGPLTLLMMLLPLFHLSPVPFAIWLAVLLVDLLVIGLAVTTGAVLPVLASLVLTLGVAALWLFRVPAQVDSLMPLLGVISFFAALFAVAGQGLSRLSRGADGEGESFEMRAGTIIPIASGLLPFALLVLVLLQLPVANPTPVFGVALLLTVLLAGLAIIGKQGPLVLAALIATLAVEAVWHSRHFAPESPGVALGWYLGFYALFFAFPFVFRRACAGLAEPWIASALSGAGHFLLVHDLVKRAFPNDMMGLLPAAFAVPSLAALFVVIRSVPEMDDANRRRIAWFGGVALLFITLIFPIQFHRQWLTVSWAMEGALLLWLFRRVPHPGLQLTGLALLVVSFVRLALNPAVFSDYPRSGTAILNWHLYAYGLVAAAQFFGGRWFTDPAGRLEKLPARGVLFALGGVLLFVLLNIEIADYFTAPGDRCVAFRFGGNFARDMTYSIAWGLFSLALLGLGIWRKSKHARFASIGLLVVTLVKLFLHDLAAIENVFRIGALVGVAVIAFVASFLYQRFFDRPDPS